ncbi:AEC family transporter [Oculatella sp. LEGE 06141]|uniref:AEC family transporter n=1 Tax=Oculatella sp. LEGE 06141 TaxID=1828648 RepID=UPI00188187FE|nr:AEC family transporter [Oculatella sp. LEGE 06141]MBE9177324.1 AEC family transporter [Oculatella sp. LEGE 06141]
MTETLVHAYVPLLVWSGLGLLLFRFLPDGLPRLLGRGLYWVGIPLEVLALARQTHFARNIGIAPIVTIAALLGGLGLAWLSLQSLRRVSQPASATDAPSIWEDRSRQGSFLLSSTLGNTGFVGLAIAPALVSDPYVSWIVFYSITHNIIGTYGIGVVLSSYFGRSSESNRWWMQLRDVLTVPSLWAFALGYATQSVVLPDRVEDSLHASIWVVIPIALLLMGMRLSQLNGWKSLKLAIVPAILKVIILPAGVGLATRLLQLPAEPSLALVLMSGMPTAFAGLILAEEYELDRETIASSIVLTTGLLLLTIPLWLLLWGQPLPSR